MIRDAGLFILLLSFYITFKLFSVYVPHFYISTEPLVS